MQVEFPDTAKQPQKCKFKPLFQSNNNVIFRVDCSMYRGCFQTLLLSNVCNYPRHFSSLPRIIMNSGY
jgi:hypothetical protein